MMEPAFTLQFTAVIAAVIGYYWLFVGRVGDAWAQTTLGVVLRSRRLGGRYSVDELDSVVRLALAIVMQACFCLLLLAISGVSIATLVPHAPHPGLVLLGVALGVGEAALGSYLGYAAMQVATAIAPSKVPRTTQEWLATGRGGWMRFFLKTARLVSLPQLAVVTFLYVAVEEAIFRGVLINFFSAAGPLWAIGLSTMLFVAVQTFHMPSWHSALFPVMGALAIGAVHGLLYQAVPDLLPLVVAHVVLFLSAVQ